MSIKFDTDWFRNRIAELGTTQAKLAHYLDRDKATIAHLISGKRRLQLDEVEPLADFLQVTPMDVLVHAGINLPHFEGMLPRTDGDNVEILEIDVRAGTDDDGNAIRTDEVRDVWHLPSGYARQELRVSPETARLIEVKGDSMEPTLKSGDRMMIDTAAKSPSPSGIFALWDGVGVVVKRVEHIIASDPPAVRLISDNQLHAEVTLALDETNIMGRVVWIGRRV